MKERYSDCTEIAEGPGLQGAERRSGLPTQGHISRHKIGVVTQ